MDAVVRNRLIAGAALLVVFLIGYSLSGETTAEVEEKVDRIRASEKSPEQAQAEALARTHKYKETNEFFAKELAGDFESFAVAPIDIATLRKPNAYEHLVTEPKVLAPGNAFNSSRLNVKAVIEQVKYRREGAEVNARHAIAKVRNVSDVPVAYYLRVRSADRGECKVRGSRTHNAMTLLPGETADVVVCAGTGGLEILDLRVLEVTPIGHVYLSKLPPGAVGYDAVSARSHQPGRKIELCSQVPSVKLANLIKAGTVEWQDIADFYSRHNCERGQYVDGYRHATEDLAALPYRSGAAAEPETAENGG